MPILPVPVTPISPKKLIPYAAGPVLPFKSSPPPSNITFREGHALKSGFVFVPKQSHRHFFYLFRFNLPQSHGLEHSFFCKDKYSLCPFHYTY